MGTFLDAPVQILMGTNVRGAFTAEDNRDILDKLLGTAAPKAGARLPEVIEKRRSDMASQGMILPLVGYADDERLAPNQFLVTVALQTVTGDIRKDILFDVVVDMIKAVQIQDPSKKGVRALLVEAVNNLVEKNYQESMDCFRKVSYWGSIIGGCEADCVRATLCYGAVNMMNGQYQSMTYDSQLACNIVDKPTFSDPYLKYAAHRLMGISWVLMEHPEHAVAFFEQAYHDLEWANEETLLVEVLFHAVTAMMQAQQYDKCRNVLDRIYSLVKDSDTYGKEAINKLYVFRAFVSDRTIEQLKSQLSEMELKYEEISRSFLLGLKDTVLKVVRVVTPSVLTFGLGSILGNVRDIKMIWQKSGDGGMNLADMP